MDQVKNDIASAIFRRVVKVTITALIQDWTVCSDSLSMENLFLDACKYLCRLTRPERRFGFSSWYLCFRPLKETCRAILGQVSEHPEVESLCHCGQGCGQSCITSTSQSPEAVIRSSNAFKRRFVIQDISQSIAEETAPVSFRLTCLTKVLAGVFCLILMLMLMLVLINWHKCWWLIQFLFRG